MGNSSSQFSSEKNIFLKNLIKIDLNDKQQIEYLNNNHNNKKINNNNNSDSSNKKSKKSIFKKKNKNKSRVKIINGLQLTANNIEIINDNKDNNDNNNVTTIIDSQTIINSINNNDIQLNNSINNIPNNNNKIKLPNIIIYKIIKYAVDLVFPSKSFSTVSLVCRLWCKYAIKCVKHLYYQFKYLFENDKQLNYCKLICRWLSQDNHYFTRNRIEAVYFRFGIDVLDYCIMLPFLSKSNIRLLQIEFNVFSDEKIRSVFKLIQENHRIRILNLSSNQSNDKTIRLISKCLEFSYLNNNISNNNINNINNNKNENINNSNTKTINNNNISIENINNGINNISSGDLSNISSNSNSIGSGGYLREFIFRFTNLNSFRFSLLLQGIIKSKKITIVNFSDNEISGDQHLDDILNSISNAKVLHTLNLARNLLTTPTIHLILQSCLKSSIKNLDLRGNPITKSDRESFRIEYSPKFKSFLI